MRRLRELAESIRDGFGGPLHRGDRARWEAAQSLEDLGELTAGWLAGDLASQPGYYGPVDVDEGDAPGLTATLVALNRAGLVTTCSQAGYEGPGWHGQTCQQLAAVEGFARSSTVRWLRQAMDGTEYQVVDHGCKDHVWQPGEPGIDVTFLDGRPCTGFGTQTSRVGIARDFYPDLQNRQAIDDAAAGRLVVVYDPVPGRNTMWARLRLAADLHQSHAEHTAVTRHEPMDTDDDTDGM